MKLSKYLSGLEYETNIENIDDIEITGVTSDSRQWKTGCIYVCIKGEKFDGHSVAEKAIESLVGVVVVEKDLGLERQIIVKNTRSAYGILCSNHFENPSEKFTLVGVTGTNGKTTITSLIKNMLSSLGHKVGLIGTIQNEIGDMALPAKYTTPDPYQLHAMFARMAEAGCEYVIMETSSHALDQFRLEKCNFAVGVFTNLTHDHLDYHNTMEEYFQAKKRLVDKCEKFIVNIDDQYGKKLACEIADSVITCSVVDDSASFLTKNICPQMDGNTFDLICGDVCENGKIPMPGAFSVMNGLQAVATVMALGFSSKEAVATLGNAKGVAGRCEVINTGKFEFTIIRDYAHAPDSLEKMTATLKQHAKGRLVTLFGCAGNRDRKKRPDMGIAAGRYSDFIILTSDNPRSEDEIQIMEDCKPGLDQCKVTYKMIADRYTAIIYAIDNLKKDDVLLLAGKGHEDYQVLQDETIYFDEKVLVEEILAAKGAYSLVVDE